MRLRKSVGAFVVNKKGEFLLVKGKDEIDKIYWDIPRGGIEKGEKPIDALKRELKEELGIIKIGKARRLNLSYSFEFPDRIKEAVGFGMQKVDLFFVRLDEEKIKIDKDEILGFKFLDKDEFVKKATYETTKKAFEKMIKKIRV